MSKIVLCVDDSATMQQVADITFRGTEFTYVGARNYSEGLDKAKSQKPALILADSQMPGQSGYDLCLALKSDAGTSSIPVAILIGNAAPYDNARGTQVGADANLPKPWDTQTMLEKVTEIIGKAATGVAKPGGAAATAPAAPVVPAAAAKAMPPGAAAAAAAAAAASAAMPPRSATIMGMPTIKMPAGNAQPVTPATPMAVPNKTTVMAVPPISPGTSPPGTAPAIRSPAPPAPAPVAAPVASVAPLASVAPATSLNAMAPAVSRAPMISGTPTKRSVLVERTLAKMAARLAEASGLDPGSPELLALLKLSTEVIERIVWEVVPDLAEQIIRENLHDLTARRS